MKYLEEIDARDRTDGTPRMKRLRQIPPETGRFLAVTAATAPKGLWLEIGASAGYSTLWLALAAREAGRKIITFEIMEDKAHMAGETFNTAGIGDVVELITGDALELLPGYKDVGFCFLDAEKEIYGDCYEAVVPNLVNGGILIADNAMSHRDDLQPLIDRALNDNRVDALVVPIGKGELVCRKV